MNEDYRIMPATQSLPLPVKLLSLRDLTALLGRSLASLHRDRATGRLPAGVRLGKIIRYDPREIEAWLAAGAPDRKTWEAIRKAGRAVASA